MLSFFKSKKSKDSAIEASELINEEIAEGAESKAIQPKLSIHPLWNLPNEKKYVYSFLNQELPTLLPNQLSLSAFDFHFEEDKIIVSAFVRSSLNQPITLGDTKILLLDEEGKFISRETFNFQDFGQLPPLSSRPWLFAFKADLSKYTEINPNWKLAFELKSKHSLDLDPSWEESLPQEQKDKLKQLVDELQPPKESEVNIMGLNAQLNENEGLIISVLIRNGRNDSLTIEQLPIQVLDANNELIAKGGFKLNNFTVKGNTTKPWRFVFPKELVLIESPDFSKWRVELIQ